MSRANQGSSEECSATHGNLGGIDRKIGGRHRDDSVGEDMGLDYDRDAEERVSMPFFRTS